MQQKCKNIRKYAQKCLERAVIYAREAHKICHFTESTVLNFSTGMQSMQIISTKYADICNKNERICIIMLKIYIKYPNIAKKMNMHKICHYIDFNMHIMHMQNMQNACVYGICICRMTYSAHAYSICI